MKKRPSLNIGGYADNAADKFSFVRLGIYTAVSLALAIALVFSAIGQGYSNSGIIFTGIAFLMISGFAALNIVAIIKKIQNEK